MRGSTWRFDVSGLYPTDKPIVIYRRDRYSLRDDCGSPDRISIPTVGGSTTDQRFIPFEDTFQKVLEDQLTAKLGRKVCVSNAGIDGHSSYAHVASFESWFPLIPGLKPKVFLFYTGVNDADFYRQGPAFAEQGGTGPKAWGKRSEVVQLLIWARNALAGIRTEPVPSAGEHWGGIAPADFRYTVSQVPPGTEQAAALNAERYRGRLRTMIARARAYGADVVCATQPDRMTRVVNGKVMGLEVGAKEQEHLYTGLEWQLGLQAIIRVVVEECGPDRTIELHDARFDAQDFYDPVHTTPSGSRRLGAYMADWFEKSPVLQELGMPGARPAE